MDNPKLYFRFVGGEGANTTANILPMFRNSFVVSISVTIGTLIVTSLSAYAYERLDFKGGDKIFWVLMYMSMFPMVEKSPADVPNL